MCENANLSIQKTQNADSRALKRALQNTPAANCSLHSFATPLRYVGNLSCI